MREEYSTEQKPRLLQYTTGTAGVPSSGFAELQSNDGNIKKFTINSIDKKVSVFPRAHTCFNRIDLPHDYESKEELNKFLSQAIQMSMTGFDMD